MTPVSKAEPYLSAHESDPTVLGWMEGYPPPPERLIRAGDSAFFDFPALRWSVVHMRQFMLTVNVSRGLGAPTPLPYDLDDGIDALTFVP